MTAAISCRKRRILFIMFFFFSLFAGFSETITLATLDWEPFFGEFLQGEGVFAALSREAFERSGYELMIKFVPWKRALEQAKTGYYDGLMGAYYNSERAPFFIYTDPVMQTEEVFLEKKGADIHFESLEDLKDLRIGTINGFSYNNDLLARGFRIDLVTDDISNIEKLYLERVDLIIIEKSRFLYLMENNRELTDVKGSFHILTPSFQVFNLYCTISNRKQGARDIVNSFNRSLEEMREDGTYDRILREFLNNSLSDNMQRSTK